MPPLIIIRGILAAVAGNVTNDHTCSLSQLSQTKRGYSKFRTGSRCIFVKLVTGVWAMVLGAERQ